MDLGERMRHPRLPQFDRISKRAFLPSCNCTVLTRAQSVVTVSASNPATRSSLPRYPRLRWGIGCRLNGMLPDMPALPRTAKYGIVLSLLTFFVLLRRVLPDTCEVRKPEDSTKRLIREDHPTHGVCQNEEEIEEFRECFGRCESGTIYEIGTV